MTGYKTLKIYVEGNSVFCDIAIFTDKDLIVDNIECCEKVIEKIPYSERLKYGKELLHNFINDMLIFK